MDIVLFFQSTEQLSWRKKLSGVHRFAREHNWFVQVIERFATAEEIRNAIRHWNPVGCLVDRAMSSGAAPDKYFRNIPTVYLDQNPSRPSTLHPTLLHDSAAEADLSGGALLDMNLKSYAYIGAGQRLFWDDERFESFRKSASERGHKTTRIPKLHLKRSIMALPKPCGILASNDQTAVVAFHAAVTGGFSVPEDVAIAGIDNDEMYCESISPGITSAEPDFEGAGYRLAGMLADEIKRHNDGTLPESPPRTEYYGPLRLVRRGSTASAQGMNPRVVRAVEFIRCNAGDRMLDINAVAEIMKCSRRLATLLFRKETGHTILTEIRNRRFGMICDLLRHSSLPISSVIRQCGYGSESFIKRFFMKKTGMSMKNFRNLNSKL